MKKLILSAVVLFAAVAGYNCYNNGSSNDDEMTDLMKANVRALAYGDGSREDCMKGNDLCEMLVIYPGGYGYDIIVGVKKPGWL